MAYLAIFVEISMVELFSPLGTTEQRARPCTIGVLFLFLYGSVVGSGVSACGFPRR